VTTPAPMTASCIHRQGGDHATACSGNTSSSTRWAVRGEASLLLQPHLWSGGLPRGALGGVPLEAMLRLGSAQEGLTRAWPALQANEGQGSERCCALRSRLRRVRRLRGSSTMLAALAKLFRPEPIQQLVSDAAQGHEVLLVEVTREGLLDDPGVDDSGGSVRGCP
jgi:hypothetical protein